MEQSTISDAVHAFLTRVDDNDRPFRQLTDFLGLLSSQGWAHADVESVRRAALVAMASKRMRDW
jgi:hypothetical protein